jgi:hypothetical protein
MLPRDSTASPVKVTEGNFQMWCQLTPCILETTKNHRFSYPAKKVFILNLSCIIIYYLHGWFTIQGVSEIRALILTGNRTHQNEQLFSLPFWRKTLRNGLKK